MAAQVKSVLVTGASRGLGAAVVDRLQRAGWRVFAAKRRPGPGSIELDICDADSIRRARDELQELLGGEGLSALVNNAGISVDGPVELVPLPALREQFEVNLFGHIAVTQALLPMLRAGEGRVVNIGGAAGRMPLPMYGALSASKAALDAMSAAMRMELKYQGVHVAYVEPGALQTRFFDTAAEVAVERPPHDDVVEEIYARPIETARRKLAASRATPVEAAVDAVERALTSRRPRGRYRVGPEARFALPLLGKLPTGVRDRLVMSSLGLGRGAFTRAAARGASCSR
jgi:NAD(P)-dependent dehydrogenase (short-subunit alcohol dehydrogenase family)